MEIWQLCANLLIPNCLRSNLSYSPLAALELYVNNSKALMFLEKALAIYRSTLGEEDNSTKETLEWIKYVTSLQAKQSFVQ